MNIGPIIFNAIRALVADRVFQDIADANTVRPYITYQYVGGDSVNFYDATVPSKRNYRVQFNVWADSRAQAMALAEQVEDALRAVAALQTTVMGAPVALYEPDTKLRGTLQYFSFWA